MKTQLSSFDIHYLVREWSELIDAKLDKVFSKGNTYLFQMHAPGKGKRLLKIQLPGFAFITDEKGEFTKPNNLCIAIRKFLGNARLRTIEQVAFERIIHLGFENKEGMQHVYVELFHPGNLVLCRSDMSIVAAHKYKRFSKRIVRGGATYEPPLREYDLSKIYLDDFKKAISTSDKESLVKSLAIEFGLGGIYAEELCLRASMDKNLVPASVKNIDLLYDVSKKFLSQDIATTQYFEKDITPIPMLLYEGVDSKQFSSFNEAIKICSSEVYVDVSDADLRYEKKKQTILSILKSQEEDIKKLEKEIDMNTELANYIYNEYATVQDILYQINQASEKLTSKEIKKRLKGHKIIKEVNLKDGIVLVEL